MMPQTKVMILTAFLESAFVFKALAAGARAFVSKDADRADAGPDPPRRRRQGRHPAGPTTGAGGPDQSARRGRLPGFLAARTRGPGADRGRRGGPRDRTTLASQHGHRQDAPPAPLRETR